MKIVLTDAQTVLDDIVNADVLNQFGEVESFGLLKYEEVAEKIADADIVVCNKTLLDSHTMQLAKNLKYIKAGILSVNNEKLCRQFVAEEYQDAFLKFTDMSTLAERMKNEETIAMEYQMKDGNWHKLRFIEKKR